jgi:hypothetical protein
VIRKKHCSPLGGFLLLLPACLLTIAALSVSQTCSGQDPAAAEKSAQDRSALGVRHQRVEQMMLELERKFTSLSEKLQQTEPERAKRLVEALQKAKELLIQKRLGEVTDLLNDARYDRALTEQQEILESVKEIIKMLLNEQLEEDKQKEEERKILEQIKKDIENALKAEQEAESETNKVANKDETLKDLDAKISAVKDLIEKQGKVNEETETNKDGGIQQLDRIANQQHAVRKETEDVASKIANAGQPKDGEPKEGEPKEGEPKDGQPKDGQPKDGQPKDGQPKDGQPKDGQPKDGQPKDGQPKDGQPKDGQPKDGQPKDGQPKDGQPKDGQPKDGQPKDGQPKDGQPKDGQPKDQQSDPNRPPQPGEQQLKKAAENQKKAEDKLARGKADEAQKEEKEAADNLQKALDELEKEKRRIASLPPEAFDQMAKQQKKIEDQAKKIQEDMEKAAQKKNEQSGDPNAQNKTPGQEQMKEAQQAMEDARKNLEEQDAQAANRQQKKAVEEMKKALREIEERLKQLRDETQEEKLARLEARFNEMLAKQQLASAQTVDLHEKRLSSGDKLRRGDLLQLAKLTAGEREIAELAQLAYEILMEDGTSVVFPEIVLDLKEDLNEVADLLEGSRTDELTQALQQEIELTLEELLDALKKEQRQRAGGGGGGGGGGGNPPLLPKSAELKMLRSAQLRVNRRTKKFDEIRGANELDAALVGEVDNIAERQLKIIELTEQVIQSN